MPTITRFISTGLDMDVLESSDPLEQLFIDNCKKLGLRVRVHPVLLGRTTLATQLTSRENALAALDILREEGHKVFITNGVFYPEKYAIVSGDYN